MDIVAQIRCTSEAIESVKSEAKLALNKKDKLEFDRLMGNLVALEAVLANQVSTWFSEMGEV